MEHAASHSVTNLPHPPDDNSLPLKQQNKIRQETQVSEAKKARSQTERIEAVPLEEFYKPGETGIPSDENWKLMGLEWLKNLEKAKHRDALFSGVRTKGHTLKYTMHLAPTEGQTMWVLRHCSDSFDALMRKRKR